MNRAPKYIVEKVWTAQIPETICQQYLKERDQELPKVIYPDIRVLTANKRTYNRTFYPESSLRGDPELGTGLISFNRPYPIPVIRDHLDTPGIMGITSETYGRVYHPAQIHGDANERYLRAMPTITHAEAIEHILTGRWMTVSLGSQCESVSCSICGQELTDGGCDHQKGQMYEVGGEQVEMLWVIGPIRAKELSFVLSPSDDQAGVITPNLKESFGGNRAIPRILVGDDKGIFDLATGARVAESSNFTRPHNGSFFGGLSFLGSHSLKESHMADNPNTKTAPSLEEVETQNTEAFKGEGRYLLTPTYYDEHDHDVILDGKGDGVSSPGGTDQHTHEILGGVCRSAGEHPHCHYMEVAHAAPESTEPEAKVEEAEDEPVCTLGDLYGLPEDHEDFTSLDCSEAENAEAKLTTKARNALPDSAFCGPDRSFPAHDAAHVRNGLARVSQSKFSSEEKARIRACLERKAKKLGVKVSDEMAFAAKLVDKQHQVEIAVYPMPADYDTAEAIIEQIKRIPHTPSEREAILSRVAAHCKDVLTAAEWQTLFWDLTTCEAGEPVEIVITAENYGFLYVIAQGSPAQASQIDKTDEAETKEAPETSTKTSEEKVEETAQTDEVDNTTEDGVAVVSLPKAEEKAPAALTTADAILTEQLKTLQARLAEADQRSRLALAHSCAIYMKTLRHPLSRGKSAEQLIELLTKRSAESLTDTLSDLLLQIEANKSATPTALPKVEDPTQTSTPPNPTTEASTPGETSEVTHNEAEKPNEQTGFVELTEDEQEETVDILGTLFENIRRKPKK
jgi:hypothetical protein